MYPEGRILLIDEDKSVRDAYARGLREDGFEVAAAASATEALGKLDQDGFDVVLTAASLPEMDGLELLRRMREHELQLPVVVMLERLDNLVAIRAAEEGAFQYLVKPIEPRELVRVARHAIASSARAAASTLRERHGESAEPPSVTATEAKNEFARALETAIRKGAVVIKKHGRAKAVLLSVEEYESLARSGQGKLDSLSREFDSLLARMQTPEARRGMEAAFGATSAELANAAVAGAKKRG